MVSTYKTSNNFIGLKLKVNEEDKKWLPNPIPQINDFTSIRSRVDLYTSNNFLRLKFKDNEDRNNLWLQKLVPQFNDFRKIIQGSTNTQNRLIHEYVHMIHYNILVIT